MHVQDTALPGVKIVALDLYRDERGFFCERYSRAKFQQLGLPVDYVQDNHSRSAPGVVRGLHYQRSPDQAKLVGCLTGRIWDVAVDIRAGSPSFGQSVGVELSGDNGLMLYIPAGFAHGFCVLGDESADVLYKVDGLYNPQGEGGIRYDDPDLGVAWPVAITGVSPRDGAMGSWKDYCAAPAFSSDGR